MKIEEPKAGKSKEVPIEPAELNGASTALAPSENGAAEAELDTKIRLQDIKSNISFKQVLKETGNSYRYLKETKYGFRPMATIMIVTIIQSFDKQIFGAIAPELRIEFGKSLTQLVTIGTIVGLFTGLGQPAIGYIVERASRRLLVGISAVVSGICTVVTGFTQHFRFYYASRTVNQIIEQFGNLPLNMMMID